jgi:hypothetical protein
MMASSVASEWVFSSAGIMISACNHLNADIVEAIQCLKSLNSEDLMLRVLPNITNEEKLWDNTDQ